VTTAGAVQQEVAGGVHRRQEVADVAEPQHDGATRPVEHTDTM
jgi:hypothetical protein